MWPRDAGNREDNGDRPAGCCRLAPREEQPQRLKLALPTSPPRLTASAPLVLACSSSSCAILHDRDNDGDLDVGGIDEVDDLLILFENR